MHFDRLILIHLFWLIPILVLFFVWSFKRKNALLERFSNLAILKKMMTHVSLKKQYFKATLLVVFFVFLILAIMEPKWGSTLEEIKRKGLDVIVAVDVSRSMLAGDEQPNRLERAKRSILDLLKLMKGDRIGLIAFSGNSFVQCPLTVDYGAAKMFVDEINPRLISKGGTSLGSAIRKSISAFEGDTQKHRVLILITDGEDHGSQPLEAAKEAKEKGIKIFCIGIGSPKGTPIKLIDERGKMHYLKDKNGNQVLSKLDENLLKKIAYETDGAYVPAQKSGIELDQIYTQRIATLEKREIEGKKERRFIHRFQWPLAIAALFLILESILSDKI